MGTCSRQLLGVFLSRFLWTLVLVLLFAALSSLLGFLTRYPYVPLTAIVASLPDFVLLLLPFALPFSALLGGCLFAARVRRHQGFLWIQLMGRDPRRYQVPILVFGGLVSLGLWGLSAAVLPHAQYRSGRLHSVVRDAPLELALRLVEEPRFFPGYRVDYEAVEDEALTGFSLVSRGRAEPVAVTGARAELRRTEDGAFLELKLHEGRILRLEESGELDLNLAFDRLRIRFDVDRMAGPGKQGILDLKYYTDSEMDRLPAQARVLGRHGIPVGRTRKARIALVPAVRTIRLQTALMPFLFVWLVVLFLGVHLPGGAGRRTAVVVVFCLAVLLTELLLLEIRARKPPPIRPWVVLLPTIQVAAVTLAWLAWRGARRWVVRR